MQHEIHSKGGERWIAAFSSASVGGKLRYEWTPTLEKMGVNYIVLFDEERSWWHFCYEEVLDLLTPYKPTCIGSSMGGYGALMFAEVMGVEARAFGPQTAISESEMGKIGDSRWDAMLERVRTVQRPLDLKMSGDRYHVYYCAHHDLDAKHAERLDVKLFPVECNGHNVARVTKYAFYG